jgi:hypothetical protein
MYLRFTLRARAAAPFLSGITHDLDEKIQVRGNVTLGGRGTYQTDEAASRARRPGIHYAIYAMTR